MDNNLIKSKERVSEFGEVYTPDHIVQAMLDLVKDESYRIDARFLEPACGNGNFLEAILKRKVETILNVGQAINYANIDKDMFIAVSNIYGIDILDDNIRESKDRLMNVIKETYNKIGRELDKELEKSLQYVLDCNIILGNTLTGCYPGVEEKPENWLIISEWIIEGDLVKRIDYYFNNLCSKGQENIPILETNKTVYKECYKLKEYKEDPYDIMNDL